MATKALEVSALTKTYGTTCAINNLSFSIEAGEIFGLLGPNGAGKTSLISILTTLEEPSSGGAKIFGHDVLTQSDFTKPLLGVVPQEIVTHGFFEVQEILQFQSGYYGVRKNQEHIDYLLNKLSLWDHRHKKVKQLSGGMKRRLMIAKALVHKPKLLLLDEPTAGVDIELREGLWDFVREMHREGLTILLTTHYLQEAETLCDRIAVINKGELCCLRPTREIITDLSRREIVLTTNSDRSFEHPLLVSQTQNQLKLLVPAKMQVGDILQDLGVTAAEIVDLQVKEGGLEEAMKFLLKGVRT
ncbi:MAG: putative ATP-binding component of a transport system [Pseudomonadota bacterium]